MAKQKIKGSIWVDSIFGTIFIYFFMFVVSNITAFKIFDALDPIGQALEDFEMTDYAFSQMRDQPQMEENIVLVNIGNLPRAGIAEQIRILDKYNPRVIGVDSFFKGYVGDTLGTLSLANAITTAKSDIIMVAKVDQSDSLAAIMEGEEIYDVLYLSDPKFTTNTEFAIANLDTEAAFQQDVKICRQFPSYRGVFGGTEQYVAFGAALANKIDSTAISDLKRRKNDYEIINYRGDFYNFFDPDTTEFRRFGALDFDDVLYENFEPSFVEGKVVILGYMGEDFTDLYSWEDKFFTPLNKKVAGRATPDMYGPVIHANIASMVLNRDYVNGLNPIVDAVVGVLLCFINVLLFSWIYRNYGSWYDGITKLIQVIEVIVILGLITFLFATDSFKLEIAAGLFALALAGDLLEVYYGVVRNTAMKLIDRFKGRKKVIIQESDN